MPEKADQLPPVEYFISRLRKSSIYTILIFIVASLAGTLYLDYVYSLAERETQRMNFFSTISNLGPEHKLAQGTSQTLSDYYTKEFNRAISAQLLDSSEKNRLTFLLLAQPLPLPQRIATFHEECSRFAYQSSLQITRDEERIVYLGKMLNIAGILFLFLTGFILFNPVIALIRHIYHLSEQQEQNTRKHQALFSSLINQTSDIICIINAKGNILFISPSITTIAGWQPEELKNQSVLQYIDPKDHPKVMERIASTLQNALVGTIPFEFNLITRNGQILPMESVSSNLTNDPAVQGILVNAREISARKRTEHELRESRERFALVAEGNRDAIWDWNLFSGEMYYSPRWRQILGYLPDKVHELGNPSNWHLHMHPEDAPVLQKKFQIFLRSEDLYFNAEFRMKHHSGHYIWLETNAFVLRDEKETPYRMAGSVADISERKAIEFRLIDDQKFIASITSITPNLILINDFKSNNRVYTNRSVAATLGYQPGQMDQLDTETLLPAIHPEDQQKYLASYQDLLQKNTGSAELEFRMRTATGEYRWFDGMAVIFRRDEHNIPYQVLIMIRDVHSRKEAEERLLHSRHLLHEAQKISMMGSWDYSVQHGMEWSQALYDILEYDSHHTKATILAFFRKVLPADISVVTKAISVVLRDKSLINIEFRLLRLDGSWRDVQARISPITDSQGSLIALRGTLMDISSQKTLEMELRSAMEKAEAANKAKSAFLSSMSHEFRTPLNAIIGFAQILRKDSQLQPQQQKFVELMFNSGNHLLGMINDVLDISKIEAGRMDLIPEVFSVHMLIDDINGLFGLRCQEKGLQLITEIAPTLPEYIETDIMRLRQALINLTGNAVKFTAQGSIFLRIYPALSQKEQDAVLIHFEVEDTGRGIPAEQLEAIFEPFRQVNGMYSEGTGLGLAITSRIVRMMGGELSVKSILGKGTVFCFELPLKAVYPAESPADSQVKDGEMLCLKGDKKWKVLIVDDILSNRLVVRTMLEQAGFECHEATNGMQAVLLAGLLIPDIILMDLHMPEMTGYEAMQNIRQSEQGKELPIIALTASGLGEQRSQLKQKGFTDYLRKPFLQKELFEILENCGIEFQKQYSHTLQISATPAHSIQSAQDIAHMIYRLPLAFKERLIEAIEFQDMDEIQLIVSQTDAENIGYIPGQAALQQLKEAASTADFPFLIALAGKLSALSNPEAE